MAAGGVSVSINRTNGQSCGNWKAGTRLSIISIDDPTIKTFSIWVCPRKELGTTKRFLAGSRDILSITSANNWNTTMNGASVSVGAVTWDTWQNWIITYDGSAWKYYKDEVFKKSITTANYSTLNVLGSTTTAYLGFAKKFRVYDVQFTAEEIAKTAAGGEVTRGLKYSWDLTTDVNGDFGSTPAWTNTGIQFGNFDMTNEVAIRNSRVGATDKFLVNQVFGDTIMVSAIAES